MVITTKSAILEFGKSGFNGNALIEGMRFSGVLGIPIRSTGEMSAATFATTQGGVAFDYVPTAGTLSGGIGVTAIVSAAGDNFMPQIGDVWTVKYAAPLGSVGGQASGGFVVGAFITESWTRIA